jgi:hypothetical protein
MFSIFSSQTNFTKEGAKINESLEQCRRLLKDIINNKVTSVNNVRKNFVLAEKKVLEISKKIKKLRSDFSNKIKNKKFPRNTLSNNNYKQYIVRNGNSYKVVKTPTILNMQPILNNFKLSRERYNQQVRNRNTAEKAEKNRLAKEQQNKNRAEQAEKNRIVKEQQNKNRAEKAEKERLAKIEQAEKNRIEKEQQNKIRAEQAEKERLAKAQQNEAYVRNTKQKASKLLEMINMRRKNVDSTKFGGGNTSNRGAGNIEMKNMKTRNINAAVNAAVSRLPPA